MAAGGKRRWEGLVHLIDFKNKGTKGRRFEEEDGLGFSKRRDLEFGFRFCHG